MTDVRFEPGSFRDPANAVFYAGDRVLRGLDERAAAEFAALQASAFFPALTGAGKVVQTGVVEEPGLAPEYAAVLEHERIPFVSYPYEWSFSMLRDAAALHLEVLLAALDDGFTMKDGYSFNVQWRGVAPIFIDIGSFEQGISGPWVGYRQFCQTFLYPLMLEAYLGVPFQRELRGDLEGVTPTEMRRLLSGRRRFKRGVFKHVYLHSVAESRVTERSEAVRADLGKAGFGAELAKATVRNLAKLVARLRSRRADSAWHAYRQTCSYSDEERAAKARFVEAAVERVGADGLPLAWDLGANDGAFARIAAQRADHVVAVDYDDVTVDAMYRSLREDGVGNVLPLVMNLLDPSPNRGWRGAERQAFVDRGRPNLVLALALVHHLAIAANVPLREVVSWLRSLGGALVVEFVERHDPMATRLLANKRAGLFPEYEIDVFERLLAEHYDIAQREPLPGGTRTLYLALPR